MFSAQLGWSLPSDCHILPPPDSIGSSLYPLTPHPSFKAALLAWMTKILIAKAKPTNTNSNNSHQTWPHSSDAAKHRHHASLYARIVWIHLFISLYSTLLRHLMPLFKCRMSCNYTSCSPLSHPNILIYITLCNLSYLKSGWMYFVQQVTFSLLYLLAFVLVGCVCFLPFIAFYVLYALSASSQLIKAQCQLSCFLSACLPSVCSFRHHLPLLLSSPLPQFTSPPVLALLSSCPVTQRPPLASSLPLTLCWLLPALCSLLLM